MANTLQRAFKIPEIRKRIFFVLAMIAVFRLGSNIPVPGMDISAIKEQLSQSGLGDLFSLYDLVSGGGLQNYTIFALGVSPYITSSIIFQLLAAGFESLEELQKSGEDGRQRISKWTRYLAVAIAIIQSIGLSFGVFRGAVNPEGGPLTMVAIVMIMTAGSTFVMWLGEIMTEKGIGNGTSMLIFAGIVSRYPEYIIKTFQQFNAGTLQWWQVALFFVIMLAVVLAVVKILDGQRQIPIQYAKRVVGRTNYGKQSSFIPIKVNQAGVIPVIFASSVMALPQLVGLFIKNEGYHNFLTNYFSATQMPGVVVYALLQFILIVLFSFFYISITFDTDEISTNLKNASGFIPGIRPGKPTSEYLRFVSNRLTVVGAIFLALIAALPTIIISWTQVPFQLGGTSLLIVVGVVLEVYKQLKSRTAMKEYSGFLK